jgi:RNA polymerase sigma factor (sigma-70 family)
VARLTFQNVGIDRLGERVALADDAHAFDTLVCIHAPRVRRLARRLLGWNGDVEDVVQEVFLTALKRMGSFRGDSSVATWLTAVTINQCRTHQRRALLRLDWLRRWKPSEPHPDNPGRDEVGQRVRQAVAKLPQRDREVIVLFYLEELPVADIAELLRISNNAVDVRLHRARARLKPLLGDLMSD